MVRVHGSSAPPPPSDNVAIRFKVKTTPEGENILKAKQINSKNIKDSYVNNVKQTADNAFLVMDKDGNNNYGMFDSDGQILHVPENLSKLIDEKKISKIEVKDLKGNIYTVSTSNIKIVTMTGAESEELKKSLVIMLRMAQERKLQEAQDRINEAIERNKRSESSNSKSSPRDSDNKVEENLNQKLFYEKKKAIAAKYNEAQSEAIFRMQDVTRKEREKDRQVRIEDLKARIIQDAHRKYAEKKEHTKKENLKEDVKLEPHPLFKGKKKSKKVV